MSDQAFHDNLDELIKLLRKMKEKSDDYEFPGVPKMFFSNFDFVINNYEMMKNQISDQLLNQFGEPIKQMVADMVEQLREELGDDLEFDTTEDAPANEPVIEVDENESLDEALQRIDKRLKAPGLSETEIDKLLDERSKIRDRLLNR
jgi:predicted  nucleic acid-binding Zn-ribbon protein